MTNAHTTNDDQFLTNDPDDTNPMQDMTDDEELPEDNGTPFSPPNGVQDRINDTYPFTDGNIDIHQRYDGGIEDASDVDMPKTGTDTDDENDNQEAL